MRSPILLAVVLVGSLLAREAAAQCAPLPPPPRGMCSSMDSTGENDCDGDGCRVREGDCNDCDVTVRGPSCPGGTVGTRTTPPGAAPEICDGKDNNCALGTDEGPGGTPGTVDAGLACFVPGQQGVCRNSVTACMGTLGVTCPQTVNSSPEVCDGLDNNCNGDTDESGGSGSPKLVRNCFPTPASTFGTPDAGICQFGQQACNATAGSGVSSFTACGMCGVLATCAAPVTAANPPAQGETVCNGLDDDCDGTRDDGIPGVGGSCPVPGQQGRCAQGQLTCNGGGGIVCTQTVFPAPSETCNGIDDDCDGLVDEDPTNASLKLKEQCAGNNTGPCRSGERACNATAGSGVASWTACGQCGALATCQAVVPPTQEICDTVDNDCDGTLNNGNPGGGGPCTNGAQQGICRNGTFVCQASGMLQCISSVMPGQQSEICDGLDNDCDGDTDEVGGSGSAKLSRVCFAGASGFTGTCGNNPNNCNPRPVCRGVLLVCPADGGSFPTCTASTVGADGGTQVLPSPETCDSLDNDCDGTADNNVTGTGGMCTPDSGVGFCATSGTVQCTAGALVCRPRTGVGETCNGIDDDCDGDIDESGAAFTSMRLSRLCFAGDAGTFGGSCASQPPGTNCSPNGACRGVPIFCTGGMFPTCTASTVAIDGGVQVFPSPEVCDAVDNDCDGQNNEMLSGAPCTTSGLGVCRDGIEQCRTTGVIECVPLRDAGPELCDNLDNDCNGIPDDNVPPRPCYDGPSGTFTGTCGLSDGGSRTSGGGACSTRGLCRASTQQCNAGAWLTCGGGATQQQVLPRAEICNGQDEDCEGNADNGLIVDFDNDGVRACGTCGANPDGGCDCQDDAGTIRPGRLELCNGFDDNCNGLQDEASTGTGKISRSCYSGPPNTAGTGVCVQGTQQCSSPPNSGMELYGACMGERVPSMEVCNTLDDDCDGTPDNGFDVDRDGFRACMACGLSMNCDCDDTNAMIRPGALELCDNVDNDCNGMVDDNIMPRACFSDAQGTIPPPTTYTGTCPGPTCMPRGTCRTGTQACAAGNWGVCTNPTLPRMELCDGADDDCDGTVDNGNFDLDRDSYVSCALCGNRRAPDGGVGCDCNDMDPAINPGAPEICDNVDNNCDMITDGTDTACYSGPLATRGKGECRDGVQACMMGMGSGTCRNERLPLSLPDGGVPVFVPDGGPNDPEFRCDGLDEDCDGVIDDGFDLDGDGVTTCQMDCDDSDPFNKPGGREICDCKDNNCDTTADEGTVCRGAPCFDFDKDGFTNCQGDCNDDEARGGKTVGPNRPEIFGDNLDNDCDGQIDENVDEDGDGFTTGGPANMRDCNDKFADVNPGAVERCDGFDNNCDGRVDEGFDEDNDRVATCAGDCEDRPDAGGASINPTRREVCGNMRDDNCNGLTDEDTDNDNDGVSTCAGDCNDFNQAVHGAAGPISAVTEICDGQDNNCDGQTDEGFDQDDDTVASCFGDCNDADPNISTSAFEVPGNGIDDDCDGQTDEGQVDRDGDGFTPVCGDCNDFVAAINPHAMETCNRIDDNCDAYVDALPGRPALCSVCFDADGDGQTNCDGDCNDADRSVFRGAPEICDLKDNDCDMQVDLDPSTGRRVCTADAGIDAGIDAGTQPMDAGVTPDGGGTVVPEEDGGVTGPFDPGTVATGCGCAAADGPGLLLAALALLGARRRRPASAPVRRASGWLGVLLVVVLPLLTGCPTALTRPEVDAGASAGGEAGGGAAGDGGLVDAGVDAGFLPPENWPCPGLSPQTQAIRYVPGTMNFFATPSGTAVSTNAPAQALLFEGADLAGFVLQRDVPSTIDPLDPAAAETIGNTEIDALNQLTGSPLVRDRLERSSRLLVNDERPRFILRTLTSSQLLTFGAPTSAFAVRNRLLSAFSGKDPAALGQLPTGVGATDADEHVVNVFFRVNSGKVFAGAVVTPLSKLKENLIRLNDLSNGSGLADNNADPTLAARCEPRMTPALKTDFLFVIDNTISMVEEQAALQDAADGLFAAFGRAGLDFRLGVVTTDSDILRGTGFVNDLNGFKAAARVGLGGNTREMGIEFGLRAIRRARGSMMPTLQLREPATTGLVVIFLSDEDSQDTVIGADGGIDFNRFQTLVQEYRSEQAFVFSIVGPKPNGCIRIGRGEASVGTRYIDLANATGGSSGSICNPNLTEVIEEVVIGALGASSRVPLQSRPISGSLAVRTTRELARSREDGFDYEAARNSLLFFGPSAPAVATPHQAAYQFFNYIE